MKKLLSLYWKVCVVFLSVFITPACIASIIGLDLSIYMSWITSPIYIVLMFFTSMIFTANAAEYLAEISQ
jgi:hypothetical protein